MDGAGRVLTIGQLAAYAGTTIRAVRHYHHVGLLPEPDRNLSGYRTYGADAVIRLIKIRTLADAGVPLSRVEQLLDADEETFAKETTDIDRELRQRVRELQEHRRRITQLASGDTLAVPDEVADYLARLRDLGAPEALLEGERDAWILVAARYPDKIAAYMEEKGHQLEDPRVVRFYGLLSRMLDREDGDEQLAQQMADLLVELFEEAAATGQLEQQELDMDDDDLVQLLDSMAAGNPTLFRLREILAERGWSGWTRIERSEG